VFGAQEVTTGRWVYQLGRRRAADFVALLETVTGTFPHAPKVVVICDNDSIHHAHTVSAYLAEHPRLEVLYGARYSPHDNPVERIWAALKDHIANTAVTWPGRRRQIHSFFRTRRTSRPVPAWTASGAVAATAASRPTGRPATVAERGRDRQTAIRRRVRLIESAAALREVICDRTTSNRDPRRFVFGPHAVNYLTSLKSSRLPERPAPRQPTILLRPGAITQRPPRRKVGMTSSPPHPAIS